VAAHGPCAELAEGPVPCSAGRGRVVGTPDVMHTESFSAGAQAELQNGRQSPLASGALSDAFRDGGRQGFGMVPRPSATAPLKTSSPLRSGDRRQGAGWVPIRCRERCRGRVAKGLRNPVENVPPKGCRNVAGAVGEAAVGMVPVGLSVTAWNALW
jgi:hypothetical protein